jgi:NAD(P)-dependent dehydrogenase (short-subunit alcohol dehydrogenase family)
MNQIDLGGRGAVVTGGAQGIGLAVARRLLASGAKVALWDRDAKLLDETIASLGRDGAVASGEVVDVTDPAATARTAERTSRQLGAIDILVNNAGIAGMNAAVTDYPVEEWRRIIDINLNGVFNCCRAVVPGMVAKGYGRIVNVASIAGKEGNPNAAAYSASKAGVIALTKSLGKELAGHNRPLRADDAAAYRLHAGENPAGPFRRGGRDRRHGGVARLGREFVHHGGGVRHFGRTGDVLGPPLLQHHLGALLGHHQGR